MTATTAVKAVVRRLVPLEIRQRIADAIVERLDGHGSAKVSFSAAGEDLILRHLFGPGKRAGFYVDVGAWHPKRGSNTFALYRLGWSGITIDPTPGTAAASRRSRPRDVQLELAIGTQAGVGELLVVSRNSSMNSLDGELINSWDLPVERAVAVTVERLATVLDRHLKPESAIDLLAIDVEGMDLDVLQSNDWDRYRPAVVLVEDSRNAEVSRFLEKRHYDEIAFVPIVVNAIYDRIFAAREQQESLYRDIELRRDARDATGDASSGREHRRSGRG